MSLKTVTVYALECDYCHTRIPDRGSGLVGWDTTDGLDAALMSDYEWWGVTPDGRHCCTECIRPVDRDDVEWVAPDGTPLRRCRSVRDAAGSFRPRR